MKTIIFFLLFLLLPFNITAQDDLKTLTITTMSGLKTAVRDFQRDPNIFMPEKLHNIDLYRFGNHTYGKRFGFESVYKFPGIDSLLGIAAFNYRDGRNQMVAVADSENVGYGNIYASDINSDKFSNTVDSITCVIKLQDILDDATADSMGFKLRFWNTSGFSDSPLVAILEIVPVTDSAIRTVNDSIVDTLNNDPSFSADWTAGIIDDTTFYLLSNGTDTVFNVKYECRLGPSYTTSCCNIEPLTGPPNPFNGYCGFDESNWLTLTTIHPASTPDDRILTEWGTQYPTSFAQYNDMMFIANGSQTMKVYNGDIVVDYPPNAPGQMTVIPYAGDGNPNAKINGEVRYTTKYTIDSVSFNYSLLGNLTPSVKNILGMNMLKEFQKPALFESATDTIFMQLYRTKENPGAIDRSDYAFLLIDTLFSPVDDILNFTYIDSLDNSDLIGVDSVPIIDSSFNGYFGNDLDDSAYTRPGAPRLESWAEDVSDSGIWNGSTVLTIGVAYATTYVDTVLGIESALSPISMILRRGATDEFPTLQLPQPNAPYGLKKNLYRATIQTSEYDSSSIFRSDPRSQVYVINPEFSFHPVGDTIIGPFRLVEQFDTTVYSYQDTVAIETIDFTAKQPALTVPPSGLSNIFAHDNRLWGLKGSQLWYSEQGTLEWLLFNLSQFDPDDGDQGNVAWPFRGGMLYAKNFSTYNLFEDRTVSEITGAPGCVSPTGHVKANGIDYYISNGGAVSLNESQFLIRQHRIGDLSVDINNFSKKSFGELRTCVTAYVPQVEQIWFSVEDTNYVWDIRAQGWTTSSVVFDGWTLFDIDSGSTFYPGRTFYFYQGGGTNLFKFGLSELDNGSGLDVFIESGPLFQDINYNQIFGIGLWSKNISTQDFYSIAVGMIGIEDTALTPLGTGLKSITFPLNKRKSQKEIVFDPELIYRLVLATASGFLLMDSTSIDRIDIFYKTIESPVLE